MKAPQFRKARQKAEHVDLHPTSEPEESPKVQITPNLRRVLVRSAEILEAHAKLLRAFGTDAAGEWAECAKKERADYAEANALARQLDTLGKTRPLIAPLVGGDI